MISPKTYLSNFKKFDGIALDRNLKLLIERVQQGRLEDRLLEPPSEDIDMNQGTTSAFNSFSSSPAGAPRRPPPPAAAADTTRSPETNPYQQFNFDKITQSLQDMHIHGKIPNEKVWSSQDYSSPLGNVKL